MPSSKKFRDNYDRIFRKKRNGKNVKQTKGRD
jgi:hypothetical protein